MLVDSRPYIAMLFCVEAAHGPRAWRWAMALLWLIGCGDPEPQPASAPVPIDMIEAGYYRLSCGAPGESCRDGEPLRKVLSVNVREMNGLRWTVVLREDVLSYSTRGQYNSDECFSVRLESTPYDIYERPNVIFCPRDGGYFEDDSLVPCPAPEQCYRTLRLEYFGTIDPWPQQGDGMDGGNPTF